MQVKYLRKHHSDVVSEELMRKKNCYYLLLTYFFYMMRQICLSQKIKTLLQNAPTQNLMTFILEEW